MYISSNETLLTNTSANYTLGPLNGYKENCIVDAVLRYIALSHTTEGLPQKTEYSYFIDGTSEPEDVCEFCLNDNNYSVIVFYTTDFDPREKIKIDGWDLFDDPKHPADKVLSKYSETVLYINSEKHKVLAVVKEISDRWLNAFLSALPRIMSWYYPKVTQEDVKLFKTIVDNDKEEFIRIVNSIAPKFDFEIKWVADALSNYSVNILKTRRNDLEMRIDDVTRNINNYQSQLSIYYESLGRLKTDLYALIMLPEKSDKELYDFFYNRRKNVSIRRVSGTEILYSVSGELEYYDSDEFDRVVKNKSSYLYTGADSAVREVMKAVFKDNKGRFITSARFKLQSLNYIEPVRNDYTSLERGCPHPHITFHACLGGNRSFIQDALSNGEWDLAVDQTISAVHNINFADPTAVGSFLRWLKDNKSIPCIRSEETGELMSVNEFYETIKS